MFQVLTVLTSTSRFGKPAALRRMSLHLLAGKSAKDCTGGKYGTCICHRRGLSDSLLALQHDYSNSAGFATALCSLWHVGNILFDCFLIRPT